MFVIRDFNEQPGHAPIFFFVFSTDAVQWDCIESMYLDSYAHQSLYPIFELMTDSLKVWILISRVRDVFLRLIRRW